MGVSGERAWPWGTSGSVSKQVDRGRAWGGRPRGNEERRRRGFPGSRAGTPEQTRRRRGEEREPPGALCPCGRGRWRHRQTRARRPDDARKTSLQARHGGGTRRSTPTGTGMHDDPRMRACLSSAGRDGLSDCADAGAVKRRRRRRRERPRSAALRAILASRPPGSRLRFRLPSYARPNRGGGLQPCRSRTDDRRRVVLRPRAPPTPASRMREHGGPSPAQNRSAHSRQSPFAANTGARRE